MIIFCLERGGNFYGSFFPTSFQDLKINLYILYPGLKPGAVFLRPFRTWKSFCIDYYPGLDFTVSPGLMDDKNKYSLQNIVIFLYALCANKEKGCCNPVHVLQHPLFTP